MKQVQMSFITFVPLFLLLFTTCHDPNISSDSQNSSLDKHAIWKIGDTGPAGGIIFYDKGQHTDGWRYLEAAPADLDGKPAWGGRGIVLEGGTEIGSGESNTERIVRTLGAGNYAAKLCYDLELGNCDDWFLPSSDELAEMYRRRDLIGGFQSDHYFDYYWSSSEKDSELAYQHSFYCQFSIGLDKRYEGYIRPIRAF